MCFLKADPVSRESIFLCEEGLESLAQLDVCVEAGRKASGVENSADANIGEKASFGRRWSVRGARRRLSQAMKGSSARDELRRMNKFSTCVNPPRCTAGFLGGSCSKLAAKPQLDSQDDTKRRDEIPTVKPKREDPERPTKQGRLWVNPDILERPPQLCFCRARAVFDRNRSLESALTKTRGQQPGVCGRTRWASRLARRRPI